MTPVGKAGRVVDSSGVLNNCADISFTSVKRGTVSLSPLVRYVRFVSLVFLLRNLLVESRHPEKQTDWFIPC